MAKSLNKYNGIYVMVEPMDEKLVGEIDNKNKKKVSDYLKVTSRLVIDKYEWDQHDTKKIMGILSRSS